MKINRSRECKFQQRLFYANLEGQTWYSGKAVPWWPEVTGLILGNSLSSCRGKAMSIIPQTLHMQEVRALGTRFSRQSKQERVASFLLAFAFITNMPTLYCSTGDELQPSGVIFDCCVGRSFIFLILFMLYTWSSSESNGVNWLAWNYPNHFAQAH